MTPVRLPASPLISAELTTVGAGTLTALSAGSTWSPHPKLGAYRWGRSLFPREPAVPQNYRRANRGSQGWAGLGISVQPLFLGPSQHLPFQVAGSSRCAPQCPVTFMKESRNEGHIISPSSLFLKIQAVILWVAPTRSHLWRWHCPQGGENRDQKHETTPWSFAPPT